jgi:CheY-like chemotaxis protein
MNPANPLDTPLDTLEHSARRWGGAPEPSARSVVAGTISIGEWALPLQPQPGGTHALLIGAGDPRMRRLCIASLERIAERIHAEETEEAIVAQAQISRPALVVLDAELSQGSGLEACRRIREHPLTRETAIIVVSANADPEERERAFAAGADAFVLKPFRPTALELLAIDVCALRPSGTRQASADDRHRRPA